MCTVVMFCLWWAALAVGGFCNGHNDPVFHVNGQPLEYQFIEGDTFLLTCGGIALDDPALPRLAPALRVLKVRLDGCWPRAGSYAAALRALNVTAHDAPALGIAPTYFVDLKLTKVKDFNVSVLAAVPTLCNLTISDTTLTSADFAQLPVGLERLNLNNTKTGHLSAAALARLPRLYELAVFDSKPMQVEAVGNLTSLVVNSCATTVTMSLSDTLRSLELWSWAARHPEPWLSCTSLKFLALYQFAAESLPDGWLTHCQQMSSLRIEGANKLSTLAAGVLRGAKALQKVKIWGTALEALPAGLLDDAPELRELDLSSNRLHTLPSDLFQRSKYLSQLDLSSNKLARSVLEVVGAATSLTELNLNDNTALDACCNATHVSSPLRDMSRLGVLSLRGTGTRCVCASWRRLPRLKRLDLLETKVTRLNFIDMQFRRVVFNLSLVVSAVGLSLQRQDYYNANFVLFKRPTLTLDLRGALRCDCELYWAAVLLSQFGNRLQQVGGTCTDGRALEDVPLDDLVCVAPGPCAEGCACSTREDVTGRVLRLDCFKAGLTAVPRIEARAALQNTGLGRLKVDLRLEGNKIDQLSPEDFPSEFTVLDLRNNSLRVIDVTTVEALVSRARRDVLRRVLWCVLLAGNPLDCSCRAAAALATLRAHTDVFTDAHVATCPDGTPLASASPPLCDDVIESGLDSTSEYGLKYTTNALTAVSVAVTTTRKDLTTTERNLQNVTAIAPGGARQKVSLLTVYVAAASSALVLALVVAVIVLRQRLRVAMRAQPPGILRFQRRRPEPDEWSYDAFVSFAHADEAVACELVERLEGGSEPLRLCVHYRDWMPGGWIPAQIAASVRVSRRTVALVSEAFLRSKWARAEFREAYAAALEDTEPRLVLVLLEEPARLLMDTDLQAYVSGNTYVLWGDPWFWQKLRQALPAPSAQPAAESRAAAASPPPT